MTRCDVAIIGAGPVGLTAALLLAKGGARVALIEAATQTSDLPRAISIADESFRIMDRLGLATQLQAEAHLDTGARYFGLNDKLLASSKPAPSRTGFPAKSQFDQPVMEDLLWEQAQAHENITMLIGNRAMKITQSADTVHIDYQAEQGAVKGQVTADWLIGADGGRSFTRDALGIKLVGSTQQERWIVIDLINAPGSWEPYAEFHGNGVRPFVFVPGINGRLRLEYMLFAHEDADEMTAMDQILEFSRPFHNQVRAEDVRRATVYVAHQRVAQHYREQRAFLIGDAAHLMPPFSGQGLNAGVRDAMNLSWKLLEVMHGKGTQALLDSYETERRTHGEKMVRVSQRTGAVVMATGPWKPRLRDFAFRAMRLIPPMHRYFASMRFITPPNYRDGVAVAPASDVDPRYSSMVGLAVSQPRLTLADGSQKMLDHFIGDGWALLEVGGTTPRGVIDPFWIKLGATRVRIIDQASQEANGVVDHSGLLAQQGMRAPHYILVRPDRYVAAVFTAEGESATISSLSQFLQLSQ